MANLPDSHSPISSLVPSLCSLSSAPSASAETFMGSSNDLAELFRIGGKVGTQQAVNFMLLLWRCF